ncbi:MAG: hypothetical protein GXO07_06090 [Crenarchaeota archaeon]|nr:hypothetical protein [Thermoproteota archaeon]
MVGLTDADVLQLFRESGLERYLLDRFVSLARIEVELELEDSHLKLGSGKEAEEFVDNPLLRLTYRGQEVPVIPGSSLKGALRSSLESLAISRGDLPLEVPDLGRCTGDSLADTFSKAKSRGREAFNNKDVKKCFTSPLMIIFGAPWVAGRAYFGNFYPISFSTTILKRTAIDRLTMSVAQHKLHEVEVVEPGATFKGIITLRNVLPDDKGDPVQQYAYELFRLIQEGFYVGGDRSRGGGFVKGRVVGGFVRKVENGEITKQKVTGFSNGKFEVA